jgi:hypothetical protein
MTPYPFLQANLEVLGRKNPSVYGWLKDRLSLIGPSERLVRNSGGLLDWRLETGKTLFGAVHPGTMYRDWRIPAESERGMIVIVGCNLGYGLNHLLPKIPCNHQVLVLEPSAEMLLACIGHTDYSPFLETQRLLFLPPVADRVREILSGLVLPCLFGKISLRSDLPSLQLGPEYALWTERCKESLEDLRTQLYTLRLRQDQMIANELQNLGRARGEASPAALMGEAKGGTAVILGAGTSLEVFAPSLSTRRGEALFATSFQTLPSLQGLGLKPHFCMAVDCGRSLLEVYDLLDPGWAVDIPLIYSTTVSPDVVRKYPGPTIPVWTQGGLASHIRNGKEPLLDVGGNAGVAILRFLRWCGAEKVILVGQDFSWPDRRTHARLHLAAGKEFRFDPRSHIRIKNRDGRAVFTAQPYLTALGEMERDLDASPLHVYDLYGGGLPIRGSRPIGLQELEAELLVGRESAELKRFLRILKGGLRPSEIFFPKGDRSDWPVFIESARKRLEHLLRTPSPERRQIVPFLDDLMRYLQEDPVRKPLLLNEVISLAGLIYKGRDPGRQELELCREIIGVSEKKLQDLDRYLVQN